MAMMTLRDLYLAELADLNDAEHQIARELPLMAARSHSMPLRELFDEHYRDTQRHIGRLEALFHDLEERPRTARCDGVRGIVEEARERHGTIERGEVLDAALVGAALRIHHYLMAAYKCARSYAARLSYDHASETLQQMLDEQRQADTRLARLAGSPGHDSVRSDADVAASLMPAVWATETAGFASVPPRAASDITTPMAAADRTDQTYRENELMMARGEEGLGTAGLTDSRRDERD